MTFVRFLKTVIMGTLRYLNDMKEVMSIATKHTFTGSHFIATSTSKSLYVTTPNLRAPSTSTTAATH